MTESTSDARLCRIEQALGRNEICAETSCPFWKPGTAAIEGRCAFDHLDLAGDDELAGMLHDLRRELEEADRAYDQAEIRHLFYERLNAGKSD